MSRRQLSNLSNPSLTTVSQQKQLIHNFLRNGIDTDPFSHASPSFFKERDFLQSLNDSSQISNSTNDGRSFMKSNISPHKYHNNSMNSKPEFSAFLNERNSIGKLLSPKSDQETKTQQQQHQQQQQHSMRRICVNNHYISLPIIPTQSRRGFLSASLINSTSSQKPNLNESSFLNNSREIDAYSSFVVKVPPQDIQEPAPQILHVDMNDRFKENQQIVDEMSDPSEPIIKKSTYSLAPNKIRYRLKPRMRETRPDVGEYTPNYAPTEKRQTSCIIHTLLPAISPKATKELDNKQPATKLSTSSPSKIKLSQFEKPNTIEAEEESEGYEKYFNKMIRDIKKKVKREQQLNQHNLLHPSNETEVQNITSHEEIEEITTHFRQKLIDMKTVLAKLKKSLGTHKSTYKH